MLEKKVEEGKLTAYGITTWQSFRVNSFDNFHINLEKLSKKVKKKLEKNHFKIIQMPINLI